MTSIRQAVYASGSGPDVAWVWPKPTLPGNMLLFVMIYPGEYTWTTGAAWAAPSLGGENWQANDGAGHTALVGGATFTEPGIGLAWVKSAVEHSGAESFHFTYQSGAGDVAFASWHVAVFEMRFGDGSYVYEWHAGGLLAASSNAAPFAFSAFTTAWDGGGGAPTGPGYKLSIMWTPSDNWFEAQPTVGAPDNGHAVLATYDQVSFSGGHHAWAILYGREVAATGDDVRLTVPLSDSTSWHVCSFGFWTPTVDPPPTEIWTLLHADDIA